MRTRLNASTHGMRPRRRVRRARARTAAVLGLVVGLIGSSCSLMEVPIAETPTSVEHPDSPIEMSPLDPGSAGVNSPYSPLQTLPGGGLSIPGADGRTNVTTFDPLQPGGPTTVAPLLPNGETDPDNPNNPNNPSAQTGPGDRPATSAPGVQNPALLPASTIPLGIDPNMTACQWIIRLRDLVDTLNVVTDIATAHQVVRMMQTTVEQARAVVPAVISTQFAIVAQRIAELAPMALSIDNFRDWQALGSDQRFTGPFTGPDALAITQWALGACRR